MKPQQSAGERERERETAGPLAVAYGSARRRRCFAGPLTALIMEFLMGNPFSTPVGQRIGERLYESLHCIKRKFSSQARASYTDTLHLPQSRPCRAALWTLIVEAFVGVMRYNAIMLEK